MRRPNNGKEKKNLLDGKHLFRLALTVFIVYLCIYYWSLAAGFLTAFLSALFSLLIGGIIAYVINIPMSFYERHFFKNKTGKKWHNIRRGACLTAAVLSMIIVVAVVLFLIIPKFIECISTLLAQMPELIDRISENELVAQIIPEEYLETIQSKNWSSYLSKIIELLFSGASDTMSFVMSTISSVASIAKNALFALMFAFYILAGKEKLREQYDRLTQTYLRKKWNSRIHHALSVFNAAFHGYVIGQSTEAVILGTLCTLGMLIFGFPYATMIGPMVAVTALIPILGAYISAVMGAVMIFTVSPVKAILFIVYIIILQQLEGNLIYPKVVGKSIRLPGIWVLAAVTVGGGLFGILGMLIFVPLAAGIYQLVREDVERREAKAAEKAAHKEAEGSTNKGDEPQTPEGGALPGDKKE